jgi:hypothetical protein
MLAKVFIKPPKEEPRTYSNQLKTQMIEQNLKKSV